MSRLSRADIHTGYHNIFTDIPDRNQTESYGLAFAVGHEAEAEAEATHARRMLPVKRSGPLEWLDPSER